MQVHSYVLMGNHSHFLLETPEPNLVAGMKWLKSRMVVGDEWIVARLAMSHRSNVSRAVSAFRDPSDAQRKKLRKSLHICTD